MVPRGLSGSALDLRQNVQYEFETHAHSKCVWMLQITVIASSAGSLPAWPRCQHLKGQRVASADQVRTPQSPGKREHEGHLHLKNVCLGSLPPKHLRFSAYFHQSWAVFSEGVIHRGSLRPPPKFTSVRSRTSRLGIT